MKNAIQIESKDSGIFGMVPQFKSECVCGNWQVWGTTGLILETVKCKECGYDIKIDFFSDSTPTD